IGFSMEIVLARHGKLRMARGRWIAPRDLAEWIARYDRADIESDAPPAAIQSRVAASATLVSSTTFRCVQSARRLAPNRTILTEEVFREAELPYAIWRSPKLPSSVWATLFRVGWFCGFCGQGESFFSARARARIAAERLIALGRDTGSVFLTGHGIMNMLIAKQLLLLGAAGPNRPQAKHWAFSVYELG
ncbi:MAG TPA: histidine phosphatase family protein, partial [Steroidobacteraceae bacterium]